MTFFEIVIFFFCTVPLWSNSNFVVLYTSQFIPYIQLQVLVTISNVKPIFFSDSTESTIWTVKSVILYQIGRFLFHTDRPLLLQLNIKKEEPKVQTVRTKNSKNTFLLDKCVSSNNILLLCHMKVKVSIANIHPFSSVSIFLGYVRSHAF